MQPGITIPSTALDITINTEGSVQGTVNGTNTTFGQIQLARFTNKGGLQAIGDNLFLKRKPPARRSSPTPATTAPATLLQNYLEAANVEAVTEISDLISPSAPTR